MYAGRLNLGLVAIAFSSCIVMTACGQVGAPPPKYEFRGAWVATVINLDWPSRTATSAYQQTQLRNIMAELKDAGINAVIFQVRSEADAMYPSDIEPWSYWLNGRQGRGPNPFYDPLQLAIDEAHRHGMELHAWFNPYRVERSNNNYTNDPKHVSVAHPEWTYVSGNIKWLDPGRAAVRDYIVSIIMDVSRRYDIDGVHMDDYFYPYPPNQIRSQDSQTFAEESRGLTSLFNWRRDNVNLLIAQIADSLRAFDPSIKFGISPFGIWKNGVPAGIQGLDAYNVIYADATAWLQAETVDYIVPQLYWRFAQGIHYRGQDYAKLAPWWAEQINGRHLYIGHGLYRADRNTYSGSNAIFPPNEIPDQAQFNRDYLDILGSVFFRSSNITIYSSGGFVKTMKEGLYRYPALTPPMAWKEQALPQVPENLAYQWTDSADVTLTWDAPASVPARYAVYRVRSSDIPDPVQAATNATNLLAVTGTTSFKDRPGIAVEAYHYFVQSVSRNSVESAPSNMVMVRGRATATEQMLFPDTPALAAYPSPFADQLQVRFILEQSGTVALHVVDLLGRTVRTLVDGEFRSSGTHTAAWDGYGASGRPLANGPYWLVMDTGGRRTTRAVTLVR